MGRMKIGFFGFVCFLSSTNLGFAANPAPFIVTDVGFATEYDTPQMRQEVEATIKQHGIRKLLLAYQQCADAGNTGIISLPAKSVSCRLNEHRPRGMHLGSCGFRASIVCIAKEVLPSGSDARLGSEVVDVIKSQKSLLLSDGTYSDFSEFSDLLGR